MKRLLIFLLLPFFVIGQQSDWVKLENYFKAFQSANEFSGVILVVKDTKTIVKKICWIR